MNKNSKTYQAGLKDGLKEVARWMDAAHEAGLKKKKCKKGHIYIEHWFCIDCGDTKPKNKR